MNQTYDVRVRELSRLTIKYYSHAMKIKEKDLYQNKTYLPKTYPRRTPRANKRAGTVLSFPLISGLDIYINITNTVCFTFVFILRLS